MLQAKARLLTHAAADVTYAMLGGRRPPMLQQLIRKQHVHQLCVSVGTVSVRLFVCV